MLDSGEAELLDILVPEALEYLEECFGATDNKYYWEKGDVRFSVYHSGQYCIFLYFLARRCFTGGHSTQLADKLYCLNKALSGLDLFYEVRMPKVFFLDHPVGSVMGRAEYGERFSFSQNCTVGNNKGLYPRIGSDVKMHSGSKILGGSVVGDGVTLAANSYVKDEQIPEGSLVFGSSPHLIVKARR